jgi:hypothetical protein
MTTSQDASVAKGAALVIYVDVTDDDGAALDLVGVPLTYTVSTKAGAAPLLTIADADIVRASNRATITLHREDTLALPAKALHHELYTVDGDATTADDAVFMQGTLTVVKANIALAV